MDRELLKAIITEIFAAALVFVDGKKFMTLAIKLVQNILMRDAVLDKIIAALFGGGIDLKAFAATIPALPAPVATAEPELTADEMECQLTAKEPA